MPRHEAIPATSYTYTFATGHSISLVAGENGVSEKDIERLLDFDRIEDNEARKGRNHRCALTEFEKGAVHDDGNTHADPIETLADLRWAPETIIFAEESKVSLMDQVEAVLPKLTKAQAELFRLLRLGLTEGQLAKTLGISRDAVKSRRRYLFAAIRRQLGVTNA